MTTTHEQLLMEVKDFSEHMLSEEKKVAVYIQRDRRQGKGRGCSTV